MRVSGTPQSPNPPAKTVVLPFMFSRAAEAEGRILLISLRERVVEKVRTWQEWDAVLKPIINFDIILAHVQVLQQLQCFDLADLDLLRESSIKQRSKAEYRQSTGDDVETASLNLI